MEQITGTLNNAPAVANYPALKDKPQINGVELLGNKTFEELGMDQIFATKREFQEAEKTYATKLEVEELQKKFEELVDGNEVAY